jgi:flagellar biosynthetic protein FliQ
VDLPAAMDLARDALMTALLIAGPVLGIGMLVGICISLVQTVTQLHDQTLSLVPKIVAMVAATLFLVPWLAARLLEYARHMFAAT